MSEGEAAAAGRKTTGHFTKSRSYHHAAESVIAGGVNSNVRLGGVPLCFASGSGSRLTDIDGNEYIDYALGMGPAILGHAPKSLVESVQGSLSTGQLFAGQHMAERELAVLLQRCVPSAELVRLGVTGSEMVQAALRLARAFTGKSGFVKFEGHYHGWFDNVLVNHSGPAAEPSGELPLPVRLQTAGQSVAATADTYVLPWNNIGVLERYLSERGQEIAAVITEPVMCNSGVIAPRPGYLEALRRLCDTNRAVLIFDEVITGFRLGLGGAQGKFGVLPDLSIFAKALGGGFPIAALTGRRSLMSLISNGEVNHSGTYNANLVSIMAAVATLQQLAANDGAVYRQIEAAGEKLMQGIREIAMRRSINLKVSGYGSVFHTMFADEREIADYASYRRTDFPRQRAFLEALLLKGVRPTGRGTWFVSAAHSDADVDQTLSIVDSVLGTEPEVVGVP